jgi:beta-glucanase (GH16 family)
MIAFATLLAMLSVSLIQTATSQVPAKFEYTQANYASKDFDTSVCSFFDKFEGNKLDLTKWGHQNGNGSQYGVPDNWGNGERQVYATENVTVQDGTLRITAKAEQKYGSNFTSGKIVTANSRGEGAIGEPKDGRGTKFAQKYGRFEAKIRLSKEMRGLWPAFWLMPDYATYGGWPRSGEIDIMEIVGAEPKKASSAVHVKPPGDGWQSAFVGAEHTFADGKSYTDWHVYGVVWTPEEIIFLVDGLETRRIERSQWNTGWYAANGFTGTGAPFDHELHFVLNLALDSGRWKAANSLQGQGDLPVYMEVDWVRAYTMEKDPWAKSFGKVPDERRREF